MRFSTAQFQTFPPSEGYPFPTYLGSCGRFTAVEYVGATLDKYYDAVWEERVSCWEYESSVMTSLSLIQFTPRKHVHVRRCETYCNYRYLYKII